MVSSKNVKASQKRCLGASIENCTGSSPSEQIIVAHATYPTLLSKRDQVLRWNAESKLSYNVI